MKSLPSLLPVKIPRRTVSLSRFVSVGFSVLLLLFFFIRKLPTRSQRSEKVSNQIPKNLYCFWTGPNKMSDARRRCFESMNTSELNVVLVTDENLSSFILPEAPLHEGYQYLSETHKSDYLRTYFMHFYGGGYSDIKKINRSWISAWNDINNNNSVYANGFPEESIRGIAYHPDPHIHKLIHDNWRLVIGNSNYIFRSKTPFTTEWYQTMLQVLDKKLKQLKQYPSKRPQQKPSADYPYPLRWTELLGEIFHPLCYKYRSHLLQTCPMFEKVPYR